MTDIKLPMACSHKDGEAACEQVRGEVRGILQLEPHHNLLDNILYGLEQGLLTQSWHIDHVYTDMWMGVKLQQTIWNNDKHELEEGDSIYVECDSLEDGLASAFKYIWDNYEHDED